MKRFRGGLVFKAHRLLYQSTLGLRVITKKKNLRLIDLCINQLTGIAGDMLRSQGLGLRVEG